MFPIQYPITYLPNTFVPKLYPEIDKSSKYIGKYAGFISLNNDFLSYIGIDSILYFTMYHHLLITNVYFNKQN